MATAPQPSAAPVAVSASDLSLRYESRRSGAQHDPVNGATFTIPVGDMLAVIGQTGSGKSTLALAVAGLPRLGGSNGPLISGGSLTVLGQQVRGMSPRAHDLLSLSVGFVPQDAGSHLHPRLTVGENVAAPIYARDRRFDPREAGAAVATLVDAVRLPLSVMNKFPSELSRGQRQRIAIARALILDPPLLVADDPTAGIDATARGRILDVIRELQHDRGFSALIVSHTLSEVRRFSDRVAIMHRGVIVGIGAVDEVLDSPKHEYVEGLARALRDLRYSEELSAL